MRLSVSLAAGRLAFVALTALTCPASAQSDAAGAQAAGSRAQRILSIGGDVTEILYALGAEARIVAVDASSQFPPRALREKKNVGYMRALSTEGALSVGADLVLASDRAGPSDVVKMLRSAVRYVEIPEGSSPSGVPDKIIAVGQAIGDDAVGRRLAARVAADLAALAAERQGMSASRKALFVLSVQSGRATVGGTSTSADAILSLAGLTNAAADIVGFKPVGDEALHAMRPDLLVIMKRSSGGGHEAANALDMAGLAQSPAGRGRRIVEMDGLYLLGFGPRVADAARELMRAAYADGPATGGAKR